MNGFGADYAQKCKLRMKVARKWPEKWPEFEAVIIESIVGNSSVTIAELETITGLGHTTIKTVLREMQKEEIIRRVGPDKGGHWMTSPAFLG